MASYSAKNDLKATVNGKRFQLCKVTFRKDPPKDNRVLKLSELENYKLTICKNEVVCFCDSVSVKFEVKKTVKAKTETVYEEEFDLEPVELKDEFADCNDIETQDIKEERDFIYNKEKHDWIAKNSNNERLRLADHEEYECTEAYCLERMHQEFPGFYLVDESTFYWKNEYPALESLHLEKRIKSQISINSGKYGSYTRICKLEEHNHNPYDYADAIIIYNYLSKFEIIGPVSEVISKGVYGQ